MTNTPQAEREARKVAREATRAHRRGDRHAAAAERTGKPVAEVNAANIATQVAVENPPALAGALSGLVVALGSWGIDALPDSVPTAVAGALVLVLLAAAALVGKFAQRFTYDRATMDRSVANFVDDLHALGGTPQAVHADVDPDADPADVRLAGEPEG